MTGPSNVLPRRLRIDAECQRFEAQWRNSDSTPVSIEDCLANVTKGERTELLRELVRIEAYHRQRGGESGFAADYQTRFPEFDPTWLAVDTIPNSTATEPLPVVAGYDVLEVQGRGGMGVVYRVRDERLDRVVALKMLRPSEYADESDRDRFRREAEAVARLQHPNIVQVFEVGETHGRPYIALEFVEGSSLAQRFIDAPLDPEESARLIETLAKAIQHAHDRNIIHRDLKPANVLLTLEGSPKVADFGLAKLADADHARTRTGTVVGTPTYMAPEQAAGRNDDIGPRTDVYALGTILYECLTGGPPFRARQVQDLLRQVCESEPVAPATLNRSVSRDLETICLKCLRKEPSQRYQSATHLAEDLRRFLEGKPIVARPVATWERGWRWCRRNPTVASLVGLVAVVALMGAGLVIRQWRLAVSHERTKDGALQSAQQSLAATRRSDYFQRIARADLELAASNAVAAEQILDECPEDLRDWEWSYLKGQCHTELREINAHEGEATAVRFSHDGSKVATGGFDGKVHLWDIATGEKLQTLKFPSLFVRSIVFSPDDSRIHVAGGDFRKPESGAAGIWNVQSGQMVNALERALDNVWQIAISDDGNVVAGTQGQTVLIWDRDGKVQRTIPCGSETLSLNLNREGSLLAIGLRSGGIQLTAVDQESESIFLNDANDRDIRSVQFSPNGEQLISGSRAGQFKLWEISNRTSRLIHFDRHSMESATFSSNGHFVAAGGFQGAISVWSTQKSQSGRLEQVFCGHDRATHRIAFSPNNQLIASVGWDGKLRLWDFARTIKISRNIGIQGFHTIVTLPDNKQFITAGRPVGQPDKSGRMGIWNLQDTNGFRSWTEHRAGYSALAATSDGALIATASGREVLLWDFAKLQLLDKWNGHDGDITMMAFRPASRELVTASQDGTVKSWLLDEGLPRHPRLVLEHGAPVTAIAVNESRIASACDNGGTFLWDAETGPLQQSWQNDGGKTMSLAFRPGGEHLALAGSDQTVRVRDLTTGEFAFPPGKHRDEVSGLTYNPQGTRLVSVSRDGTVMLWEADTGKSVLAFRRQEGSPTAAAFTPNGQTLITVNGRDTDQGAVEVWRSEATPDDRMKRLRIAMGVEVDPTVARQFKKPTLSLDATKNSAALIRSAWSQASAGKWKEADELSAQAIARGARFGSLEKEKFPLSWLRAAFGDNREYQTMCREVLRRYQNTTATHMMYLAAWLVVMRPAGDPEHYRGGLALIRRGVNVQPDGVGSWETLALAHYRNQNWQEAIKAADKVTQLFPAGLGTESFVRAMAYGQLGEKEKALEQFQNGVRWMEKNRGPMKTDQTRWLDRRRFQIEAATLLGLPAPTDVPLWKE